MASEIINSILQRINKPDLLSVLSADLTGSELNSLLLEVFGEKTRTVTPPQLLNLYQQNRFVKPADLPPLEMKRMELQILELFTQNSFQVIDLAPVSILGSCSVVGPADQKKILSALRGTEVIADSTNAIALHVADLKQRKILQTDDVRYCNIQRMVRTQAISGPGFTPHFRVGCLVTCGVDKGNYQFEKTSLNEHVRLMRTLFLDYYKVDEVGFRLLRRDAYPEKFLDEVGDYIAGEHQGTRVSLVERPDKSNEYYKGIQYKVDIRYKGKTYEIGDGGFVDWTQQLLQNRKERMLSSGFGFDFMCRILQGEV